MMMIFSVVQSSRGGAGRFTAGLLLLSPSPVPFFPANSGDLFANVVGNLLVHGRAVSKLEKNLEMHEEGSENEG